MSIYMLHDRAELLAQELKELQAELGDYNTVMLGAIDFYCSYLRILCRWFAFSIIWGMLLGHLGSLCKFCLCWASFPSCFLLMW